MFTKYQDYQDWLKAQPALLFGAETPNPDPEPDPDPDPQPDYDADADMDYGPGPEPDDDDEFVRMPTAEASALRREVAEARKARKQIEESAKRDRERQRAEQGQWQELAEERQREIDEAHARAESAEYTLEQFQRNLRVSGIANRLGFRDPQDAIRFLDDDDTDTDDKAEKALKRLAESKDYLVERRRGSGGPSTGGPKGLTIEDIKSMSQDEINANWEAVQATMASQG